MYNEYSEENSLKYHSESVVVMLHSSDWIAESVGKVPKSFHSEYDEIRVQ